MDPTEATAKGLRRVVGSHVSSSECRWAQHGQKKGVHRSVPEFSLVAGSLEASTSRRHHSRDHSWKRCVHLRGSLDPRTGFCFGFGNLATRWALRSTNNAKGSVAPMAAAALDGVGCVVAASRDCAGIQRVALRADRSCSGAVAAARRCVCARVRTGPSGLRLSE